MSETKQPVHGPAAEKRTAGEAGWHRSRYNLGAPVPGKENYVVIVNLFRGTCAEYSPPELYIRGRDQAPPHAQPGPR